MNTLPYSLDDLYWFVLIAELGGLSATSRQYDIPKSTLSNRLARLENALGVKLMQRNTNSSSLTDAGEFFLKEISPITQRLEVITNELMKLESEPKGIVRITASGTFGKLVVLPVIANFLRQYPQVQIEIELTDKRVDIVSQGYDIAIRIGELIDSNLHAQQVGRVRRILCASVTYLEQSPELTDPEQLVEHSFIVQSRSSSKITLSKGDKLRKFTIKGRLTIAPSDNLLEAVEAGLGIAALAEIQVTRLIEEGKIARILPQWELPEENVYIVSPDIRYRTLALRLLLEYLRIEIPKKIDFLKNS